MSDGLMAQLSKLTLSGSAKPQVTATPPSVPQTQASTFPSGSNTGGNTTQAKPASATVPSTGSNNNNNNGPASRAAKETSDSNSNSAPSMKKVERPPVASPAATSNKSAAQSSSNASRPTPPYQKHPRSTAPDTAGNGYRKGVNAPHASATSHIGNSGNAAGSKPGYPRSPQFSEKRVTNTAGARDKVDDTASSTAASSAAVPRDSNYTDPNTSTRVISSAGTSAPVTAGLGKKPTSAERPEETSGTKSIQAPIDLSKALLSLNIASPNASTGPAPVGATGKASGSSLPGAISASTAPTVLTAPSSSQSKTPATIDPSALVEMLRSQLSLASQGAVVVRPAPLPTTNSSSSPSPSQRPMPSVQSVVGSSAPVDNMAVRKPIVQVLPPCEGRVIIIGDVHGCVAQLKELVDKVGYVKGKDVLLFVGDYVNKGPNSIGVVRLAIELGGIGVLGNHDYTLLSCITRLRTQMKGVLRPRDRSDPVMQLASIFPQQCENYLRHLPHIIRIPQYNVLVVHAGLNMSRGTDDQDLYEVMHMRRIRTGAEGKVTVYTKEKTGVLWGSLWNGPETVIFGHDAGTGLQKYDHAYGIDSGCVYGKALSALVYGPASPKGELVSVPGLSYSANIAKGLPPPTSAAYEESGKQARDELRIIRLPTRATPSVASATGNVPLSASAFMSSPISSVMSNNSPVVASQDRPMPDLGAFELHRTTLLALSRTFELQAVCTLLDLPQYESAWQTIILDASLVDNFWLPFTTQLLDGVLSGKANPTNAVNLDTGDTVPGVQFGSHSPGSLSLIQTSLADNVMDIVCEICEEFRKVLESTSQQLDLVQKLSQDEKIVLNKGSRKSLSLLLKSV